MGGVAEDNRVTSIKTYNRRAKLSRCYKVYHGDNT